MVNISKIGDSAIKFTFTNNDHYLYNGEIEVPLNSLILTIDSSDMATFKKIDGDPFVSFLISNSNFESKTDLETFYKENMVGEQGGGSSSGITSGEVQTMIDESISGITTDVNTISGKVNTNEEVTARALNTLNGELSGKADSSAVTESINAAVSGKVDTSAITSSVTSASTDSELPTAKAVYDALGTGGNANIIEVTQAEYDALVSGQTVDPTAMYVITDATEVNMSGYVQTSAITSAITSGSTDAQVPSAKAVYDALGESGKPIEAGRGIDITTGETADTVSFNLPISADTDGSVNEILVGNNNTIGSDTNKNIVIGDNNTTFGQGSGRYYSGATIIGYNNNVGCAGMQTDGNDWSSVIGRRNKVNGGNSYIIGVDNNFYNIISKKNYHYIIGVGNDESSITASTQNVFVFGAYNKITKSDEFALGKYNTSSSDGTTSGNTFFAIGNGTANNARHNAFEIRQNGDIYITSGGTDIKLQDNLGGGGGSSYTAGDGIDITNDVISVTGKVDTSAITSSVTSASTDSQVPSAKAVNDKLGGLSLVKLSQSEYDDLVSGGTVDDNTLYVITSSN